MSKKIYTPLQKTARFWLRVLIAAEVFLICVGCGLIVLWDFAEAYELSRPQHAIDAYMATATPERISALDASTLDAVDSNFQSKDAARQAIVDRLEKITYAKNTKLTTETEMVYMLMCSGKNIGKITLHVVDTDNFGFEYWQVTEEEFNFSAFLGKPISITVPSEFSVYADEVLLDERFITESDIPYESAKEYYGHYQLPTLCTYTVGAVIGAPEFAVVDENGASVVIDENTDLNSFLKTCSDEELEQMETFVEEYVQAYMDFTSVSGGQDSMSRNLNRLLKYMVPNGKLAQRMKEAVAGLTWVTDRNAKINHIDIHACFQLEEGEYICDLTYVIDTRDHSGQVQSEARITLVLVETENGLRAESMTTH